MKYTLWIHADRYEYLNKRLFSIVELLKEGELVKLEITVAGPQDILNLFQAGIEYGIDLMSNARRAI